MTSTARRCKASRGFTLLEIVIAITITAMILAGAVGLVTLSSDEYALKKAARELEALAKRARMTAVLKQSPQAMVFEAGRVQTMSWAAALHREGLLPADEGSGEGDDGEQAEPQSWELPLADGMQAFVKRWNSDEWLPATGKSSHAWRFDPSGLCEPLGVRLELGESSAVMVFHPLTGAINELEFDLK